MRHLFFILCFFPTIIFACTCGFSPNFCSYTGDYFGYTNGHLSVAHVKFINFRNPTRMANLYDFERITDIAGVPMLDTISLWGQDGLNCNGPIMRLDIGAEYLLMFPANERDYLSRLNNIPNPYPIYAYPGCGPATLLVTEGIAYGQVAEGISQLPLDELTEALTQCQEEGTVSNRSTWAVSASAIAYPNPAHDAVTITTSTSLNGSTASLFDLRGQLLSVQATPIATNSLRIPLATLPAGVYVVLINTSEGTIRKRIVKQ